MTQREILFSHATMAGRVRLAVFLMLAACAAASELPQPRFLSQEGKMRLEAADLVFANGATVCVYLCEISGCCVLACLLFTYAMHAGAFYELGQASVVTLRVNG